MIKEILIKGELKKFSFGLGFLGELFDGLGIDFMEFDAISAKNPMKYTPIKMQYSYNYANETNISIKEMLEMLDEDMFNPAIAEFNKFWQESLTKNVPTQEEPKKKVTPKKK